MMLRFAAFVFCSLFLASCTPPESRTVVLYTSQDQVYSEPIIRQFEKQSGIKVRPVYDAEAVKTVGLTQRLLAEKDHPQCDVFWSNEEMRTRQLEARGVFRSTNAWAAFGYRTRRILIQTNDLALGESPKSLLELTNSQWQGRISMAYPLFGSTATHFLVLRHHWGEATWEAWCQGLVANKPFQEAGNSHVPQRLARREAWIGLTDSDDIAAALREGLQPGTAQPIAPETLMIPNTVGVINNAPHPEEAEALFQYLQSPAVAEALVEVHALEGVHLPESAPPTLRPDWKAILADLETATRRMETLFNP